MGCNNSRASVISSLTETREAMQSQIKEMEEEKTKISSYLSRFSSEETMVGIDLFELKDSLSDRTDDTVSLAKEIFEYPVFISDLNKKHQNLTTKIISYYTYLNTKYSETHKLKNEKLKVIEAQRILTKQSDEAQAENKKLKQLYVELVPLYSDEENYKSELESLLSAKEELEENIPDCHKTSLSIAKEFAEKQVGQYSPEKAAAELNRILRRNRSLVSSIVRSEKKLRTMGDLAEQQENLRKTEKELIEILNTKKERISKLKNHLFLTSNELMPRSRIMSVNSDSKANSLEKIIEKCSQTPKPETISSFKNYVRNSTFHHEMQSSVARARELAGSNF